MNVFIIMFTIIFLSYTISLVTIRNSRKKLFYFLKKISKSQGYYMKVVELFYYFNKTANILLESKKEILFCYSSQNCTIII